MNKMTDSYYERFILSVSVKALFFEAGGDLLDTSKKEEFEKLNEDLSVEVSKRIFKKKNNGKNMKFISFG